MRTSTPTSWRGCEVISFRHSGAPHPKVVIARLDRATQYSEALAIKRKSPGVLDHPPSRVMTSRCAGRDGGAIVYLIGGAYWMPPALQSWLSPRGMCSFDPLPTLRS